MNDKQEIKLHSDKLYVETEQDGDKTIINIKAKDSLEDEAFDREFECCRKMKSAKPESAPHPELLSKSIDEGKFPTLVSVRAYESLRKERDDLKERCSDLDLQVDRLEAQLSKLKLENVTLKDTVIALKECESVKGGDWPQNGDWDKHPGAEPLAETWDGEGLPPVGCECHVNRDYYIYRVMYSSEHVVIVQNKKNDGTSADGLDIILDLHKHNYRFEPVKSPEQKAQREREEAAYDLYHDYFVHTGIKEPDWEPARQLIKDHYLRIVDKTGYRKQP